MQVEMQVQVQVRLRLRSKLAVERKMEEGSLDGTLATKELVSDHVFIATLL